MRLVLASNNQGKVKEFAQILGGIGIEVVSLRDMGIDVDVVEDGKTFMENAIKKATEIMKICGEPTLGDDSGLCVDYLNGAPGIYTARFSEPNPTTEKNIDKLLQMLEGVSMEKRTARFTCNLALAFPDGRLLKAEGVCEGYITEQRCGDDGFGFDPLFYYPEFEQTFAQIPKEIKNEVSHRGRAIKNLKDELKKMM